MPRENASHRVRRQRHVDELAELVQPFEAEHRVLQVVVVQAGDRPAEPDAF
jgi:hypothetical protein